MTYPDGPGFKRRGTSSESAERIEAKVAAVRKRCIELLTAAGPAGLSPDQAAELMDESILTVRPRFSELVAAHVIEETGRRTTNKSGHSANIYALIRRDAPPLPPAKTSGGGSGAPPTVQLDLFG